MTLAAAMIEFVTDQDVRLMRRVQNWRPPQWVRLWMLGATRAGDGWMWCGCGLGVLLFGGAPRLAAVFCAASAAASGVAIFLILKKQIGRKRPAEMEPHCWVSLLPPDRFSFPSGHTITAFAVATALIHFYPSLAISLLFSALSVAASRIVLGMHFLSDVLAGCAIGSALGYVAILSLS